MQMVSEIVKRMSTTPQKAEALVRERGEAADALHKALDEAKGIELAIGGAVANERGSDGKPVYSNSAQRAAEEQRRILSNQKWRQLQGDIECYRGLLREADAALENLRLRAKADEQVVALATALINAGRTEDAEGVLAAYSGVTASDEAEAPTTVAAAPAGTAANPGGVETLRATVLEVRAGKSAGTIRAFCELADGGKIAIFGKNGVGQTLAGAVGREVEVKGRHGDKGFIAHEARVA
ncbi:MAG: hypothetical protein AB1327_11455 [Bacillota bacterium]